MRTGLPASAYWRAPIPALHTGTRMISPPISNNFRRAPFSDLAASVCARGTQPGADAGVPVALGALRRARGPASRTMLLSPPGVGVQGRLARGRGNGTQRAPKRAPVPTPLRCGRPARAGGLGHAVAAARHQLVAPEVGHDERGHTAAAACGDVAGDGAA